MMTEQNERLSKLVRTLLDMSELQTVARKDEIELNSLIEEVLADLEPLAQEKRNKAGRRKRRIRYDRERHFDLSHDL